MEFRGGVEFGRGVDAAGAKVTNPWTADASMNRAGRAQAVRRRGAVIEVGRRPGVPNADAVAAMSPNQVTAAPAVPAIRAAPAIAAIPLIAAPIPTRAVPAVVIPTIVEVIEGKVLDFLHRGRAFECRKSACATIGDARFGAIGE